MALADFIVPYAKGIKDYIGTFCVTTGYGVDKIAARFEKENDDFNSIMVKALADRLAESFAEYLHREIRTRYWGYAPDENLSNEELIKESYKGFDLHQVMLVPTIWKTNPLGTDGGRKTYWGKLNRKLCYVASCLCFRLLFCPSGG